MLVDAQFELNGFAGDGPVRIPNHRHIIFFKPCRIEIVGNPEFEDVFLTFTGLNARDPAVKQLLGKRVLQEGANPRPEGRCGHRCIQLGV